MAVDFVLAALHVFAIVNSSHVSETSPPTTVSEYAGLCDDGSAVYDTEGRPNWSCSLQGCSSDEGICWDYRLDHCFDENGDDNASCMYEKSECTSRLQCFDLWLYCAGTYTCHEGVIGCTHGSCTEDANTTPDYDIINVPFPPKPSSPSQP